MNKIIGYQIESKDGSHTIPNQFFSFQIFRRKKNAIKWLSINIGNWEILPIRKGDIENPAFID